MRCSDFLDRLQRQLDDRVNPESDRELMRHARQCPACGEQLGAWRQVSQVLSRPSVSLDRVPMVASSRGPVFVRALQGLAVAAVLAWLVVPASLPDASNGREESEVPSVAIPLVSQAGGQSQVGADLDPSRWWNQVQDRSWVSQTMPTVRSVREGVAPLGRTLMRAVTILTIGARDQAS